MADRRADADGGEAGSLVLEGHFALVPEWVLDADVSDCAVRLYAVLLRYGQTSGARMPGRATLAARLRKRSTDTVDRALKELVALGAVRVEHRYDGSQRLTNRYHVRISRPGESKSRGGDRISAATPPAAPSRNGRRDAASPAGSGSGGGRRSAARGGGSAAAGVAAGMRQDPEFPTQNPPPPSSIDPGQAWAARRRTLLEECGIGDWAQFVAACRDARLAVGAPVGRWAEEHFLAALHLAVRGRGWPAARAAVALQAVAADPASRSPMRLAEAGPWWDESPQSTPAGGSEDSDLVAAEAALAEAGGLRVLVQREARAELAAEGAPVTRGSVARRAVLLLHEREPVVVGGSR